MESKATMKKECWVTVSNRVFFGYEPKRAANYTTPANSMIHANRHRYALMLRADSFFGTSRKSLKESLARLSKGFVTELLRSLGLSDSLKLFQQSFEINLHFSVAQSETTINELPIEVVSLRSFCCKLVILLSLFPVFRDELVYGADLGGDLFWHIATI